MRRSKMNPLDPARVALLKCRGLHQSLIAKRLGLGEATVSRLLSDREGGGEAYKYIKPPEFDWTRVSESEKAELLALDDVEGLSPILTKSLAAIRRRVSTRLDATVVLTRTGASDDAGRRSGVPCDFYEGAVRAVWELLTPASIIGITWGRTLSALLAAARKARLPARYSGEPQPTIIPLCGESLGATRPSNLSSSALTQGFGEVLTGTDRGCWSLSMIPVFLPGPKAFRDDEVRAVRKLLQFSSPYAKIFGASTEDGRPLVDELDIVITSISRENRAFGVDDPEFTWDTLKLAEFANLVIGDLAGVPLARPDASTKALNSLQERWIGLQEHHLRLCAQRASAPANAPAGVIVVGTGSERAACIIEAVRRGLVNHVVVDEELARTLIDRLK